MIACIFFPRFELVIAAGGAGALVGRALAIAPEPGGRACVGEVSGAAEAGGVLVGMGLSEALARCPSLGLVPGDPLGVVDAWEGVLEALEGIGAAVEHARPGIAYFQMDGLRKIHGNSWDGVIAAARRALRRPAWAGCGPTRLCALIAAQRSGPRRTVTVSELDGIGWLAGAPVNVLRLNQATGSLVEPLQRLGLGTLGELAALGRDAMADRFGVAGAMAHGLACGEEEPLRARTPSARLVESLELWESSSGETLERVLAVLVQRLLARQERRGRTLAKVALSARLVEGGTWREEVPFRQPVADARRIGMALSLRLAMLPAPAQALRLEVVRFGTAGGDQGTLLDEGTSLRRVRLAAAIGHLRSAAGKDAAMRAVCVDPHSRVPERRVVLAPFEG